MFDTLIAVGTIAIQVLLFVSIAAWIAKAPLAAWMGRNSFWILKIIFGGAVLGSLIYEFAFDFAPCVLCWYQRIAIFSILIILFTANLTKSTLLRLQVLILSSAGLAVALFHNYITIFPNSGVTVCGVSGVSCTVLYVFKFGYITIPLMSATILLSGIIFTLLASRYPQEQIA